MNHRVRLSNLARMDLVELTAWYQSEGGESLADRFQAAADETLSNLESNPGIGRLWPQRRVECIGLRKQAVASPFSKTLLFYQTTEQGIYVVRVLRGERDLESLISASTPQEDH